MFLRLCHLSKATDVPNNSPEMKRDESDKNQFAADKMTQDGKLLPKVWTKIPIYPVMKRTFFALLCASMAPWEIPSQRKPS